MRDDRVIIRTDNAVWDITDIAKSVAALTDEQRAKLEQDSQPNPDKAGLPTTLFGRPVVVSPVEQPANGGIRFMSWGEQIDKWKMRKRRN